MMAYFSFIVFFCQIAFASSPSIEISTDLQNAGLDDEIQLTIAIDGSSDISMDDISVPGISDFETYGGQSSSSISIVNGRTQMRKDYSFTLVPKKEGIFKLGPVQYKGKQFGTAITINIQKSSQANIGSDETPNNNSQSKPFFVEAKIDNEQPYVWEQIQLVFNFWSKVPIYEGNMSDVKFNGFIHEKLPQNLSQREAHKIIDGEQWKLTQIYFPIFPTQAGELEVPSIELQIKAAVAVSAKEKNKQNRQRKQHPRSIFDSFFNDDPFGHSRSTQLKIFKLKSDPIKIKVQSLPQNPPVGFNGAVGEFYGKTTLSQNSLRVGDSTTLTFILKGDGHLPGIKAPAFLQSDLFKIYEDRPKFTPEFSDQKFYGEKIFKWALVPSKEHNGALKAFDFSYFDPKKKQYKTIKGDLPLLTIAAADPNNKSVMISATPNPTKNIKQMGDDLMAFIHKESEWNSSMNLKNSYLVLTLLLLNIIGLLLSIIFRYLHLKKIKMITDPKKLKKMLAYKNFQSFKAQANQSAEQIASKRLRQYLGDKLGHDGLAWTPMEVEKQLEMISFPKDLSTEIITILKNCDLAEYAGSKTIEQNDFKSIEKLVKKCEKILS